MLGLMIAMTSERYVPGIVMMMMTSMMIMIMFQVLDVVWMISQD